MTEFVKYNVALIADPRLPNGEARLSVGTNRHGLKVCRLESGEGRLLTKWLVSACQEPVRIKHYWVPAPPIHEINPLLVTGQLRLG